jgi:hypothetical protein
MLLNYKYAHVYSFPYYLCSSSTNNVKTWLRALQRPELFPLLKKSPVILLASKMKPFTGGGRAKIKGYVAAAGKPATGEGMDKSTLAHTQIQIIIIHFLPSPIPPIPNG